MAKSDNNLKTLPSTVTIDVPEMDKIGLDSNVRATIIDNLLVIVIDTTHDLGQSSTGKMVKVGSCVIYGSKRGSHLDKKYP